MYVFKKCSDFESDVSMTNLFLGRGKLKFNSPQEKDEMFCKINLKFSPLQGSFMKVHLLKRIQIVGSGVPS